MSRWWRISVADEDTKKLAGTRRRNDSVDCVCKGFRHGDQITATMAATVGDCFVMIDGTPLEDKSEARNRVTEHVLKLAALKGRAEATLAKQVMTVLERS